MKKNEARRPKVKGCQSEALSVRSCSYLWDGRDHLETGQGEVRVTEQLFVLYQKVVSMEAMGAA